MSDPVRLQLEAHAARIEARCAALGLSIEASPNGFRIRGPRGEVKARSLAAVMHCELERLARYK